MLKIHWFLPTGGDSRDVAPSADGAPVRPPSLDYLAQVARAADQLGFDAVLTPCGTGCEDAWLTTAMLVPQTKRLRFLVAFRPGLLSPTLAAQMASTYQRLSGGRVLLNIVTGAEPAELARFGDWADKDTRYERTGEFIEVMKGSWGEAPFDFSGEHYRVAGATTREIPAPAPEVYFGGASPAAEAVAARTADVYLAWGEPLEMVAERVVRMRTLAAAHRRELRYGIRLHVIARPTADEAWEEAARLQRAMSPDAIAAAQADFATSQSEGQRRMARARTPADRARTPGPWRSRPNLWSGIGLVRGGAGTALVGSFDEVAARIAEYADVGFEEFILSGYPHLEEAWWVGEGLLPLLASRGLVAPLVAPLGAAITRRSSTSGEPTMSRRLGLLMCGHVHPDAVHIGGDYPELFSDLFDPLGFDVVPFAVADGQIPGSTNDCDGWITSPSRSSVTDTIPWIDALGDFVDRRGPGRTTLRRACASATNSSPRRSEARYERAEVGWGVGVKQYEIVAHRWWMEPDTDTISLVASHEDQVIRLPPDATLLARSTYCPIAAFELGERCIAIQPHVEFTAGISGALIDLREDIIGAEIAAQARSTLVVATDRERVASWLARFITGAER